MDNHALRKISLVKVTSHVLSLFMHYKLPYMLFGNSTRFTTACNVPTIVNIYKLDFFNMCSVFKVSLFLFLFLLLLLLFCLLQLVT